MRKATALLAFTLMSAVPTQADDTSSWWRKYFSGAHLVQLADGKKLSLYCEGQGSPVVMMEAGLSSGATVWFKVQSGIARFTKVCTYDRAGFFKSPPAEGPRDAGTEANDLAALLSAAKLAPPYVIMGHSYGGYIARLFAYRHTAQMAGLVLVDPSVEHQADRFAAVDPLARKNDADQLARLKACSAEPRPDNANEICPPRKPFPEMPEEVGAWYVKAQTPAYTRAVSLEFEAMDGLSSNLLDAEKKNLGDLPFILLNRDPFLPKPSSQGQEAHDAIERVWLQMHMELMDLSTDSQLRVVSGATHPIQRDRPQAVIAAVRDVVAKARSRRRAGR